MQVSTSTINHNSETFIHGTYNGFSILIRDSDKYVNATKMVALINKKDGKKKQLKKWFGSEAYAELSLEIINNILADGSGKKLPDLKYELHAGYSNDLMGSYIHPKLVNAVAMWVSPKYLLHVSEIMDSINARTRSTGETFDEVANEIIAKQSAMISQLHETSVQQEIIIHNESVRTDNSNKMLYIIEKEGERHEVARGSCGPELKLCANSTHKPKNIKYSFMFPASMNMKQDIKKEFALKYYIIDREKLDEVIEYINSKDPKA